MSKKYKLYINNNNIYGCNGTYKVMDGRGNTLVAESSLELAANGKTLLAEQTLADTDIAYWGGTRFTFTSVGAPTSVSGEIARNDYHYYDLAMTPITYYDNNGHFSMSYDITLSAVAGQTITFPLVLKIDTNQNFSHSETITFNETGTQSLHYTESNFSGQKGAGYIYIKDENLDAVFAYINTQKTLTKPSLVFVSTTLSSGVYTVITKVNNNNETAVTGYAYNDDDTPSSIGSIAVGSNTNATITSDTNSGNVSAYFKVDNVMSDINSLAWTYSPTLSAIVINSATMISSGTLSVSCSNPNSVSVTASFYANGGSYGPVSKTLVAGSNTFTFSNVPNTSSSCWFGGASASGYNQSSTSNTISYTAYVAPTPELEIDGDTSISVGDTGQLYAYNGDSDPSHSFPLSGITWNSSNTSVATINSSGVVSGVSSGTTTITATKSGYTSGTATIRIVALPQLSAPEIDVISNTTSSVTIRVFNTGNSVAATFSGSYEGDDGVSHTLSSATINPSAHKDYSISWGSGISFYDFSGSFSASGYRASDTATANATKPSASTLNAPSITYSDTEVDNGDGTFTKTSKVYATNTNSVAVSYTATVDGISSSGTISAYSGGTEQFAQIGTYGPVTSSGTDTFTSNCSFSASGYTGSSASDTHSF